MFDQIGRKIFPRKINTQKSSIPESSEYKLTTHNQCCYYFLLFRIILLKCLIIVDSKPSQFITDLIDISKYSRKKVPRSLKKKKKFIYLLF